VGRADTCFAAEIVDCEPARADVPPYERRVTYGKIRYLRPVPAAGMQAPLTITIAHLVESTPEPMALDLRGPDVAALQRGTRVLVLACREKPAPGAAASEAQEQLVQAGLPPLPYSMALEETVSALFAARAS
jgi:hypothetical protein